MSIDWPSKIAWFWKGKWNYHIFINFNSLTIKQIWVSILCSGVSHTKLSTTITKNNKDMGLWKWKTHKTWHFLSEFSMVIIWHCDRFFCYFITIEISLKQCHFSAVFHFQSPHIFLIFGYGADTFLWPTSEHKMLTKICFIVRKLKLIKIWSFHFLFQNHAILEGQSMLIDTYT